MFRPATLTRSAAAASTALRRCNAFAHSQSPRSFGACALRAGAAPLPPRPVIREDDISESFLRGTGPGGQKINKTSSAVQLKHHPTGLVVKYQGTRSRAQNRKAARRMLQERIEILEKGPESRVEIKRVAKSKKKASAAKKRRRKYRKLEEAKGLEGRDEDEDDDGEDEGEGEDEDEEEGEWEVIDSAAEDEKEARDAAAAAAGSSTPRARKSRGRHSGVLDRG